jgi:Planctomycete cytochrome C/WD domain, G-beta repeat
MFRSRTCYCVVCVVAAATVALLLLAGMPAAIAQTRGADATPLAKDAPKKVSFINDVAPILKENCYACHDAKKRSGKLEMTSYAKLRAGGTNDDPITPGNPDDSLLVQLLTTDSAKRMPPPPKDKVSAKDGALPAAKVAVIKRWVKQGARLDPDVAADADLLRELRKRWQPPAPPTKYPMPVVVTALAFTPDGQRLVAGGHHELTVWEAATGKLVERVRTRAERAYAFAFLPDGKLVVAGGRPGQEGDVRIYDLTAPAEKAEAGVAFLDGVSNPKVMIAQLLESDDSVLCLALSPDGKRLAAGGCDRQARVWDLSAGAASAKLDQTVETHADWVLGVALTPDGKKLITASRDKTAKVWDLTKKEITATFPDHQAAVYGVTVRADGKMAYTVGADKTLRLWNAGTDGRQVKAVGGHGDEVYRIVSHPGAVVLATASADKTVRLWKEDGNPLRTLTGLNDQVYAVTVSPDGSLAAGGAWDGEVRVWKVADGKAVAAFNASPGYSPKSAAK